MVVFARTPLMNHKPCSSDEAVIIQDLPSRGGVSGIDLEFLADNTSNAVGNPAGDILKCINKIEVVENGDIRLFSMSGVELFQHLWQVNGKPPQHSFNLRNDDSAYVRFPIRFGRFLGDPLFGLKLDNWSNVQLMIDYHLDPATTSANAAEHAFNTGSVEIDARLHITDPKSSPAFRAAIGTRQFYTTTSVASEEKRMALPKQNPIVGIGTYLYKSATSMSSVADELSLEVDGGDKRLIYGLWDDHVAFQSNNLNDITQRFLAHVTAAETIDLHLNNVRYLNFRPLANNSVPSASEFLHVPSHVVSGGILTWGVGHKFTAVSHSAGAVTLDAMRANIPIDLEVQGYPDRYVYWPMGDRQTLADIFNPTQYNLAEVVCKSGATAGATLSMIIEELRAA